MINPERKLVPLDLIFDYPVRWSRFEVLRDLVQNFYDAVQYQEWDKRFSFETTGGVLCLKAEGVGFSYDWLIPIGASTKRENGGSYAGYFGEGFKIASLCAVRDHDWQVELCSRNWDLRVTSADVSVDSRQLKSLAYLVGKRENNSSDTLLRLYPFSDLALLQCVLLSFYYPSNPLFGIKIWESSEVAAYLRSPEQKPIGYPATYGDSGPGIVFAGYQALGSFPYPLVFCLHDHHQIDRERRNLYKMDVIKIISKVACKLPAKASATVLEAIKSRWHDYPRRKYDFESWHPIVGVLVNNVAKSAEDTRSWKEQYPHLLIAPVVKRSNIPEYNRRRQARDWLRNSGRRYQLVQEGFAKLGYPALEQICEAEGGFSLVRQTTPDECKRIAVLEELALALLPELFEKIKLPPCMIIKSDRSVWQGMTSCVPINRSQQRCYGEVIRYHLPYIAMKEWLLSDDSFGDATSTYLHELAHMFGGDRSASFSNILSVFMAIALSKSVLIAQWQKRWEKAYLADG
ncbi:conserved hypothetical protein [Candidatus Accumulibacter aalborgensis]|uniref:Uncharacterized protein n=1 Tax=Candidatus Accumulibacter aalborgensis TaxID=1860102 RepID=A0A1A8XJT8_9PROT|nr:hypothetical protein [Candidatus Accumulibacter aalborgensis]SBT04662.1 conserved hypothetical protein [Candidatus Accumulibacter aalborgensis]